MQRQEEEARKLAEEQAKLTASENPSESKEESVAPQAPSSAKAMPIGRPFRPRITSSFSLPKFNNLPPPPSPTALSYEPIQETATQLSTVTQQPSLEKSPNKRPKTGHGQFVKSKVMPEDQLAAGLEVAHLPVDTSGMELTELEDSAENLQAITKPSPQVSIH